MLFINKEKKSVFQYDKQNCDCLLMKEKSTAVQNESKANRRISCLLIRKGREAQFCQKRVSMFRTVLQDLMMTLTISVSL